MQLPIGGEDDGISDSGKGVMNIQAPPTPTLIQGVVGRTKDGRYRVGMSDDDWKRIGSPERMQFLLAADGTHIDWRVHKGGSKVNHTQGRAYLTSRLAEADDTPAFGAITVTMTFADGLLSVPLPPPEGRPPPVLRKPYRMSSASGRKRGSTVMFGPQPELEPLSVPERLKAAIAAANLAIAQLKAMGAEVEIVVHDADAERPLRYRAYWEG